jgi:HD-like signal output (HDOD) protein
VTTLERVHAETLPLSLLALPPFPAVAMKALRVMSHKDSRLRELHDLIRSDQAFSGELLRLVNAPLFPFPTAITNTLQAVMLLGFERVQALAVTIGIRAYLKESLEIPVLRGCWRHSLACAIIAEQLSKIGLLDKDTLYTAGVMHDIGRLALAICHRKTYADFLCATELQPCDVLARERELFGVDHCDAGQALVGVWNLPQEFAVIAARHHEALNPGKVDTLTVVQFACRIADAVGFPVAHTLNPPTYHTLRDQLPEPDRHYLPADPAELASQIETAMKVMEHA